MQTCARDLIWREFLCVVKLSSASLMDSNGGANGPLRPRGNQSAVSQAPAHKAHAWQIDVSQERTEDTAQCAATEQFLQEGCSLAMGCLRPAAQRAPATP